MIKQNPVKGKRSTGDWEFCNSHKELGKKLKLLCGRLSESIILPAALRRAAKYDRSKSIRWRYCTAALITNQRLERDFLWMMDDTQYWISVIQEIGIEVNTILFFIPVSFSDHYSLTDEVCSCCLLPPPPRHGWCLYRRWCSGVLHMGTAAVSAVWPDLSHQQHGS